MEPQHLGGDRWRVRVYAGRDELTGQKHYRSRTFTAHGIQAARRDAAAVVAAVRDEMKEERAAVGTVGGLTKKWLRAGSWSPTTRVRYEAIAKRIEADLGRIRVDELTAFQVEEWYRRLAATPKRPGKGRRRAVEGTLSARTVNHHRAVLRAILRKGADWGDVDSLKAIERAKPPTVRTVEVRPPTDDVVRLLVSTASRSLRPALLVAAHTGARRGEIVGLRWSDLDDDVLTIRRAIVGLKGGGVLVKEPKGGRAREVPVDGELVAELAAYRALQAEFWQRLGRAAPADCFIFFDRTDPTGQTPHRPDWLSTAWERHRSAQGATTVRLHDLRHWHATALLGRGVSLTVTSRRLGHAQASTTANIYAHVLDDEARRAALVAGRALGAG